MSGADDKVERAADKLDEAAARAAAEGGLKAKLAAPLAEDAQFLRKLKPSLIAARARGEAPTGLPPRARRAAPGGPQLPGRPAAPGDGPNPWLLIGAALFVGMLLAKMIDWRSHAHPRL